MALSSGSMILWNPSTRKHHEIPPYKHDHGFFPVNYYFEQSLCHAYCFGHDSFLEDYKILRLKRDIKDEPAYVDLYSVNNGSWTNMGLLSSEHEFPREQDPVMFNGAFHFISKRRTKDNHGSTQIERLIMSFCLLEGKNIRIYKPDDEISSDMSHFLPINLCVFQQKLSVSVFPNWNITDRFEVWSIMNYGENSRRTCWNRTSSISYDIPGEGLWVYSARFVVKEGLLVIRASDLDEYYGYLVYDPRKQQFIRIMEFRDNIMALDYMETLVSPGLLINT